MYENYEREEIVDNNIDLCACFDPIFEPVNISINDLLTLLFGDSHAIFVSRS